MGVVDVSNDHTERSPSVVKASLHLSHEGVAAALSRPATEGRQSSRPHASASTERLGEATASRSTSTVEPKGHIMRIRIAWGVALAASVLTLLGAATAPGVAMATDEGSSSVSTSPNVTVVLPGAQEIVRTIPSAEEISASRAAMINRPGTVTHVIEDAARSTR